MKRHTEILFGNDTNAQTNSDRNPGFRPHFPCIIHSFAIIFCFTMDETQSKILHDDLDLLQQKLRAHSVAIAEMMDVFISPLVSFSPLVIGFVNAVNTQSLTECKRNEMYLSSAVLLIYFFVPIIGYIALWRYENKHPPKQNEQEGVKNKWSCCYLLKKCVKAWFFFMFGIRYIIS